VKQFVNSLSKCLLHSTVSHVLYMRSLHEASLQALRPTLSLPD